MGKSYNKTHEGYRYQITDPVLQRMNNPTLVDRVVDATRGLVTLASYLVVGKKNEDFRDTAKSNLKSMYVRNYTN